MANKNLISFLDAAQRTIIGETVEDETTEKILSIRNPVVVNIIPQFQENGQPSGGMALQLLPVYFKEFQGVKKNSVTFRYPQSQITRIDFDGGFDFRLYGQYEHIFNAPEMQSQPLTPAVQQSAPVLKLFDDEK